MESAVWRETILEKQNIEKSNHDATFSTQNCMPQIVAYGRE